MPPVRQAEVSELMPLDGSRKTQVRARSRAPGKIGTAPRSKLMVTPDDRASVADIDQDGDFDLHDFAALQRAYSGEI